MATHSTSNSPEMFLALKRTDSTFDEIPVMSVSRIQESPQIRQRALLMLKSLSVEIYKLRGVAIRLNDASWQTSFATRV